MPAVRGHFRVQQDHDSYEPSGDPRSSVQRCYLGNRSARRGSQNGVDQSRFDQSQTDKCRRFHLSCHSLGQPRAKVLAEYIYHQRGLRKLAVIYIYNEGGIGGSSAFKAQFTQLGGTIVLEETYAQGASDVRVQLTKIKAANADGVIVGSYPPDTVLVMQQARELQLQQSLFFTTESPQNPEVLREAGDAANGAVYILAAPAAGEAPERFTRAYEGKFKHKPELFAAEGYDIMRLIAAAIVAAGPSHSGPSIRDFLYQVRNYAGASGTITFDQNGDVIKPYAIKTIEAGSPKTIFVK